MTFLVWFGFLALLIIGGYIFFAGVVTAIAEEAWSGGPPVIGAVLIGVAVAVFILAIWLAPFTVTFQVL